MQAKARVFVAIAVAVFVIAVTLAVLMLDEVARLPHALSLAVVAVVAVVCGIIGALAAPRWLPSDAESESRATEALRAARQSWRHELLRIGDVPKSAQERFDKVCAELDVLAQRLQAGEMEDDEVMHAAEALGRMRVYVFPLRHLRDLAAGIVHDLTEWRIPKEALEGLRQKMQAAQGEDFAAASSAVEDMLLDRDYWDCETDNWNEALGRSARVGIPLVVTAVALSFVAFAKNYVVLGFVLAGAAGSGTSVLLRMPGLSVYGTLIGFWARASTRCLAGTVAAAMGLGVVATGVLNVAAAGSTVLGIVTSCTQACPVQHSAILFSIAAALGFSERVLTSLSESILGRLGRESSRRLSSAD